MFFVPFTIKADASSSYGADQGVARAMLAHSFSMAVRSCYWQELEHAVVQADPEHLKWVTYPVRVQAMQEIG